MNIAPSEQIDQLVQNAARPARRTAILWFYDDLNGAAYVAPVVNPNPATVYGPYPVVKSLQTMPAAFTRGALVILERLTGRTLVVTDLVDRPLDTGAPLSSGGHVSGTVPGGSMVFSHHSPTATSIAWTAGELTYQGTQYRIFGGSTTLGYVYWTPGQLVFIASAVPPVATATTLLVATNVGGVATVVMQVAGTPATSVSGAITNAQIGAGAVDAGNLAASAVTTPALAAASVTGAKVAALTLDDSHISNTAAIDTQKIAQQPLYRSITVIDANTSLPTTIVYIGTQ